MTVQLQADVNFERINLLYRNAPIAVNGLLVAFLSLLFIVYDQLPSIYTQLWSSAFTIIFVWRIALIIAFKRALHLESINNKNISRWESSWVTMTCATAIVFVAVLFFPFAENQLVILLLTSMIFMGMSSGSAISSNASRAVVISFLTITSIAVVFKALNGAQTYYYLIAFIYAFFYAVLVRLSFSSNRVVIENISLKKQSQQDAMKDQLTGLWNRRCLDLFIEKLIPQVQRRKQPFAIILLDIDFFKKYNDTYGHLRGDEVLVQIAQCLNKAAREGDLVVRFGGEEFLIVLPDSDLKKAQHAIERILTIIRTETDVTVSAGIALFSPELSFDQIVKHADDAMYMAKENGRNQFIFHSQG